MRSIALVRGPGFQGGASLKSWSFGESVMHPLSHGDDAEAVTCHSVPPTIVMGETELVLEFTMEAWKSAVRVVRGESLEQALARAGGRATAIDFAGIGGTKTWIGTVKMPAGAVTGAHHHGRHEVAIYITA